MHIAMNVGKSCKILSREFRALQGLEDLVKIRLIESAILILGVNIALAEGDIHHTVHVITEFGDIIRGKRVDKLLREISQGTVNDLAIRNRDLIQFYCNRSGSSGRGCDDAIDIITSNFDNCAVWSDSRVAR